MTCTHTGIGLPMCPTCDPREQHEGGPRPDTVEGLRRTLTEVKALLRRMDATEGAIEHGSYLIKHPLCPSKWRCWSYITIDGTESTVAETLCKDGRRGEMQALRVGAYRLMVTALEMLQDVCDMEKPEVEP